MQIKKIIFSGQPKAGNMTRSDNFDIIPTTFPKVYRKNKTMRLAKKGSPKKRKKRKSIEFGPDMYFGMLGGEE